MGHQTDASAKLFYGDLAVTWTLLRAMRIHREIGKALKALDLITLRISQNMLITEGDKGDNHPLKRTPVEVIQAIKEELYLVGKEDCTLEWMCVEGSEQAYEALPLSDQTVYSREAMWDDLRKNLAPFLKTFQLQLAASAPKQVVRQYTTAYKCSPDSLYSPVAGKYGHKYRKALDFQAFEEEWPMSEGCYINTDMTQEEENRIRAKLKVLHDKYGVEFVDIPRETYSGYSDKPWPLGRVDVPDAVLPSLSWTSKEPLDIAMRQERRKHWRKPEARWIMWAGVSALP